MPLQTAEATSASVKNRYWILADFVREAIRNTGERMEDKKVAGDRIITEDKKMIGDKIMLRLMTSEDTPGIIRWRNREWVRKNFIYRETFTTEGHENWIRTQIETGKALQFIIESKEDHKPIGSVYFRDIEPPSENLPAGAEYGIFIGEEEAVGKGYGTEAALLAVRYAFKVMKLKRLKLRVFSDNLAAARSYEKAGFVKVAHTEVTCSDGEQKQIDLMELYATDWREEEERCDAHNK